jgi:hypothetical protein
VQSTLSAAKTEQMVRVRSCCFSRCSERLVIGFKDHVALYGARTGSLLQAVALPETALLALITCGIGDILVGVINDGTLLEWDSNLVEMRRNNIGYRVKFAWVNTSGDCLVALQLSDSVVVHNLATSTFQMPAAAANVRCVHNMLFSNDGTKVLVVHYYGLDVSVVDVATGAVRFCVSRCRGACLGSDGTCIYGIRSGRLLSFDTETGSELSRCTPLFETPDRGWDHYLSMFAPFGVILM